MLGASISAGNGGRVNSEPALKNNQVSLEIDWGTIEFFESTTHENAAPLAMGKLADKAGVLIVWVVFEFIFVTRNS